MNMILFQYNATRNCYNFHYYKLHSLILQAVLANRTTIAFQTKICGFIKNFPRYW